MADDTDMVWFKALKPGAQIAWEERAGYGRDLVYRGATVKKITPTGIVKAVDKNGVEVVFDATGRMRGDCWRAMQPTAAMKAHNQQRAKMQAAGTLLWRLEKAYRRMEASDQLKVAEALAPVEALILKYTKDT